jgi:hypothetical protein
MDLEYYKKAIRYEYHNISAENGLEIGTPVVYNDIE